jgi:putative heme iron utilization protein
LNARAATTGLSQEIADFTSVFKTGKERFTVWFGRPITIAGNDRARAVKDPGAKSRR